jgi:putative transposase
MYSFSSSIYQSHAPSAKLAGGPALIVIEDLSIQNVTASAKGTADKTSELYREILDTAPGSFANVLLAKAQEAGCHVVLLDPLKHRPSQTCPSCGNVGKKGRNERWYRLWFRGTLDQSAALSVLVDGLRILGREPAWAARPETRARAV